MAAPEPVPRARALPNDVNDDGHADGHEWQHDLRGRGDDGGPAGLAAVVAYNVLERYSTGADLSGDGVCTKKEESAILRLIRLSEAFPDGQGAAGDRIGLVTAWHYFTGDSDALPDAALKLLERCATTGVGVPETATAAELGLVSALGPRLVPRPPSSRELDGLADEDGGADDGEA